jgi:tripartite-type tricarboxylate transporter receptor subunit TctC
MKLSGYILALSLVSGFIFLHPVSAQQEGLYKGKTLQILVGSGPGAGNDLKTRIFARHAPKYLPGVPNIVVENMPGVGGAEGEKPSVQSRQAGWTDNRTDS